MKATREFFAGLCTLLIVMTAVPAAAQRDNPRDSVYLELLGRAVVLSVNGELGLDDRSAAGAGIFAGHDDENTTVVFPVHFSWLSHSTKGLYLSGGCTWARSWDEDDWASEAAEAIPWPGLTFGGRF